MGSYGDLTFATRSDVKTIKGLEYPFSLSSTGGICSSNFNLDAIKDGIIQLLLTSRGERPLRLGFGTDLRRSVFAPLDSKTLNDLRTSISDAISRYEDRVVVKRLDVTPDVETSTLYVTLVFALKEDVLTHAQVQLTVNSKGVIIDG